MCPSALTCLKVLLKPWETRERVELIISDGLINSGSMNGILISRVERRKPPCASKKGRWQES